MIKVYLASPYSLGNKALNVYSSMEVGNQLIEAGFCPYIPLLSHFQDSFFPQAYSKWLEIDLEWVRSCHCLLRLPGESAGADKEVEYALALSKPVFFHMDELIKYYKETK